jgi:hypothetical protein
MDLSRLTSRQQVKYLLEEQTAVKEQEVVELDEAQQVGLRVVQVVDEDDNSIEIQIGSWTSAIEPSTEKPLKVKVIMNDDKDKHNEEEEDVKVRLKRLRTTGSRRIVESDDDEENEMDAMEEDPKEEEEAPVKLEPEEKDKKYAVAKLLGRVKQTKEKSKEVKVKQGEKEIKPAKKTQASIPKKSAVPRKSVDADKEKASSLLAEYKKTKPAAAKTPAAPSSEREPPKKKMRNTSDPISQPASPKPELTRSPIASPKPDTIQPLKIRPTEASKKSISLTVQIWDSLHDLCTQLAHEDKDSKFRLFSSSSIVDLSGSLLKHREYDFFDVDKNGAIVVQPKVPIFPEDFPPGKPEWPLSWWGIVDPALGERKDRKVLSTTGEPVESSSRMSSRSSGPVGEERHPRRGGSLNGGRGEGPQRGHPSDHTGPPPDHADYRGAPPSQPDYRGPPPGYRGPPLGHPDHRGPPPDHPDYRGPPPDHPDYRGPPPDRRGPPQQDRRGPPQQQDRRGPPPQDRRGPPPRDYRGPPPDHPDYRGPPPDHPDYRGPPSDHPDYRGPPPDRGPRDRHADDRRPRHSDDRGSRRRSDKDRGPSGKRERKRSKSPER